MGIRQAQWIREKDGCESPVFRKRFAARAVRKAVTEICGLGWFELYINGRRVTDRVFEPGVSTYANARGRHLYYPLNDVFACPRVYYCRYDVTPYLREGDNVLSAHLGNGWFNQTRVLNEGSFYLGAPRLAFSLMLEYADGGTAEIVSDTTVTAGRSDIVCNNIYYGEIHDLHLSRDWHDPDFDERDFFPATKAEPPEGVLTECDFPPERVVRTLIPEYLGTAGGRRIYDVGENISGRVKFDTSFGGRIVIEHAEELDTDGNPDFSTAGGPHIPWRRQTCEYIGDAAEHRGVHPRFSWQTFRYFSVEGEIGGVVCEQIHTDIPVTADFVSDNAVLNGLFDMYKRTQLNNIHGCVPSDCPHRERFGYTGDGQVTCETAMTVFDARAMYVKWMRDIADCQNAENGHVQHTAPFFGGGGGPGGWGAAVVIVPYTYYKVYGDPCLVIRYADNMKHYIAYMESRCEGGLVVREEDGGWFTGDWAFAGCGPLGPEGDLPLKPEYVNTYFLIKAYDLLLETDITQPLGIDRAAYTAARKRHADAVTALYFDGATGDFCGNALGANAFAVDIGLGDGRTLERLVQKYEAAGGFDTGIFATEILIRVLADSGYAPLAYRLLTSEKPDASFGHMLRKGATTLWEFWDGRESHCHPMFGGCVKTLFQAFLGIRNRSFGYAETEIAPAEIEELRRVRGRITTAYGEIGVSVDRPAGQLTVRIPAGIKARLKYGRLNCPLPPGESRFAI